MKNKNIKKEKRARRHDKIRATIFGTPNCPRLSIFKSNKHIFAQVINDKNSRVICAFHSQSLKTPLSQNQKAQQVGEKIAKLCLAKNIKHIKFDRGSYRYHGCVKILADSARLAGLQF